jgi:hypothetical protein
MRNPPMSRSSGNLPVALVLAVVCTACDVGSAEGVRWPDRGEVPLVADMGAVTALPAEPRAGASSEFWEWWGDGRAELSGYRMRVSRYGEVREAELALIYVTEPHDRRTWIKDDEVAEPHRVNVMKLNVNLAFLTGIYPYAVMTSAFAPVDRYGEEPFSPVRIVHGVQEWCGAYSHTIWAGPRSFHSLRLSYFAAEGERAARVPTEPGTLYEDALLIQLRELDGPFAGGGDWEGMLVPELWRLRTAHRGTVPVPARITREETARSTPDGEVPITRFTLQAGDYTRTFEVERDPPRRILGWTTSTGDEAELLATRRLAYWTFNALGDEGYREALGLSPHGLLPPGGGTGASGPHRLPSRCGGLDGHAGLPVGYVPGHG